MSFHFSKSKFVSACTRCNKYAWLDKHKPQEKAPVSEYTEALFHNGHKVGALAQEYFRADVDVTAFDEAGRLDLGAMLRATETHRKLGTPVIAEASFSYGGFFCSVDILSRNPDGSYDLFEVKSSMPDKPTKKNPSGVPEKYQLDAAYQRYVLTHCGVTLDRIYVVMLTRGYVRGSHLDLSQYFCKCDVTDSTAEWQSFVADKLAQLEPILRSDTEPASVIGKACKDCDYFPYCTAGLPCPSVFDVYNLKFPEKCRLYNSGFTFRDVPGQVAKLDPIAQLQIDHYGKSDAYVDRSGIQSFLDQLVFPLYSLDFETYQAVVPEYPNTRTYEAIPFQYSLHRIAKPDPDIRPGSPDLEARHFLALSGGDPRRALAEQLVRDIPFGAHVIAYHSSTEQGIIERLAGYFADLAPHLLSFTYWDPLTVFRSGYYYTTAMGGSLSLKSVAPALFPDDPGMDYHNLAGDIKNGTQAMTAIEKAKELSAEALEKLRQDLEAYCQLDTLAVVKILKKLYQVSR